ncbi:MAG TPA: hypothetical protein DET40_12005 [Lentisphaeria bacterium]|nr:MAG: hypothetical protein A2X45_16750 [Lentisphaerae bacterium GWF2_50_93]HCE44263.1 hypothetical protein [Lentisphaeria bacterium]
MPEFVIEDIGPLDVAYSNFAGEGAAEKSNGPLIDLFFRIAQDAYRKESGAACPDDRTFRTWMFATQFHLPPNIRWLGVRKAPLDTFGPATEYEFWLSYGRRVRMPEGVDVKRVCPGLFATLPADFTGRQLFDAGAIQQGWKDLIGSVKAAGLETDSRPYIEEHMQKTNDGGWSGMKLMLPIKLETLPEAMKNGLVYIKS